MCVRRSQHVQGRLNRLASLEAADASARPHVHEASVVSLEGNCVCLGPPSALSVNLG